MRKTCVLNLGRQMTSIHIRIYIYLPVIIKKYMTAHSLCKNIALVVIRLCDDGVM